MTIMIDGEIFISISRQTLEYRTTDGREKTFPISTAQHGIGCEHGSYRTPTGRFRVAEKIGDKENIGTIFRSRKPIGLWDMQTKKPLEKEVDPTADLVLTRIIWLDGLDKENANTRERYIYIHGTNHEHLIGEPVSRGCIRMKNADIIKLYDLVAVDTIVTIAP